MGEYAEMMLDGTCCCVCGEYMGSNAGYAVACDGCQFDELVNADPEPPADRPHKCPECTRSFSTEDGMRQHRYAKHGVKPMECPDCGKRVAGGLQGLHQHMEAKGCQHG